MKFLQACFCLALAGVLLSCSKDDPSPTSQVNERLTAVQTDDGTATLSYDDQGRLETIIDSDGGDPFDIFYVAGDIQGAVSGDTPVGVSEVDFDADRGIHIYSKTMANGNPVELKLIVEEEEYNPNTGQTTFFWAEYVIKVTYDAKINPLYLVLDQSGMLPTVDDIMLGSPDPTYAELNASGLVSKNNPTKIEIFDGGGDLMETIAISYQYDAAGLPTKAISSDGDVTNFIYTPK